MSIERPALARGDLVRADTMHLRDRILTVTALKPTKDAWFVDVRDEDERVEYVVGANVVSLVERENPAEGSHAAMAAQKKSTSRRQSSAETKEKIAKALDSAQENGKVVKLSGRGRATRKPTETTAKKPTTAKSTAKKTTASKKKTTRSPQLDKGTTIEPRRYKGETIMEMGKPEKVKRNKAVFAELKKGATVQSVAKKHAMTEQFVRRMFKISA